MSSPRGSFLPCCTPLRALPPQGPLPGLLVPPLQRKAGGNGLCCSPGAPATEPQAGRQPGDAHPGLGTGARAKCAARGHFSPLCARRPTGLPHTRAAPVQSSSLRPLAPCSQEPRRRPKAAGHRAPQPSPWSFHSNPGAPGGSWSPALSSHPSWQGREGWARARGCNGGRGSKILPPLAAEEPRSARDTPPCARPFPAPRRALPPGPFQARTSPVHARSTLLTRPHPSPVLLFSEASRLPGCTHPSATRQVCTR